MLPCAPDETVFLSPDGFRGMLALIWSPLAEAHGLAWASARSATRWRSSSPRTSSTAASACARSPYEADVGDGYELDDDPARIDRDAVYAYLARSYWAEGRTRETQDA